MKKSALVLALLAVIPAFAANDEYEFSYTSSCDDCGYETTRTVKTNSYKKANKKTTGYKNVINNNFYYVQPAAVQQPVQAKTVKRNYYTPKTEYVEEPEYVEVEKKYTKKTYSSKKRKYFLAHPFFQPEEGKFGSVTDLSYAQNSFKFDTISGTVYDWDKEPHAGSVFGDYVSGDTALSGKAETSQLAIKEDFSYGISDDLALLGMVQYDKTKVSLKDLSDRVDPNWGVPDISSSDSGLNLFGIGLQYRFMDDAQKIGMVSGYFQHQKDTANTFVGELKYGYKIDRTTVYGLGRLGYSVLKDGDIYGTAAKYDNGDKWLMLSYNTDVDSVIYAEAGAGVFSVMNEYVTLNGELIYGYYDWHNQLNIKGAIGFQPNDSFALNFYAMASLYDSASDKTLKYFSYEKNPEPDEYPIIGVDANNNPIRGLTESKLLYTVGDYKLKDYNEWKIGVQAILYF